MHDCQKPRQRYIYLGCTQPFGHFRQTGDSFVMPDDGKPYFLAYHSEYERGTKKPKVICALFPFFGSNELKFSPHAELSRYDGVFAIDTNGPRANGVAATAVAIASRSLTSIRLHGSRTFRPATPKPEREAWVKFLRQFPGSANGHYCLVVDSELGALAGINRREVPILDDFFLPKAWQLNYATSDTQDGFIMPKLIRFCDREADKMLKGMPRR